MHNLLAMQVIHRQRELTHPKLDRLLGHGSLPIQMDCHAGNLQDQRVHEY